LSDRLSWHHQRSNLIERVVIVVAFAALAAWCLYADIFVLPRVLAAGAVSMVGNLRLAAEFGDDLCSEPEDISEDLPDFDEGD